MHFLLALTADACSNTVESASDYQFPANSPEKLTAKAVSRKIKGLLFGVCQR
jgi:hypothetical protein